MISNVCRAALSESKGTTRYGLRRITMKKTLLCALLTLCLISSLAGVSLAQGETINLMGIAVDLSHNYMTSIISQYEEKTGNKINIISIDSSNFDTIATSKFATGDIPDIFQHFNDSNINNYDVANNFYYLNDQPWVSDLTSGARDYASDGEGNLLGLPFWRVRFPAASTTKRCLPSSGLSLRPVRRNSTSCARR